MSSSPRLKARKYLVAASTSARSSFAYRGGLAGPLVTYCLFVFVFSRVWRAAYASRPSIAGYGYAMSVWYFVVAEIPFFGAGTFFWDLSGDIQSGQVAYLVARPYGFVGFRLAEALGSALAAMLPISAAGLALGTLAAGPPPLGSALQALSLIASIAMAACLQFLLQLAIAMTAFWIEENTAFFWIFQKLGLVAGTLLPLEFLPAWAFRAARWTPLPSLSYAPARVMAAYSPREALGLLAAQAAWIAAAWALCQAVYARGRRKLGSEGG